MSDIVRLTLVSHGMTDAMSAGRFPADEPLSALGLHQAGAVCDLGAADVTLCGPELRTRQTAESLGLDATPDPLLADLDVGTWRGAALDEIDPGGLATWITDTEAAPHGAESVAALLARVGRFMRSATVVPRRIVAVTHPAVIRAAILTALDAPPKSFWRIDIAPLSRTALHHRGPGWTLRN